MRENVLVVGGAGYIGGHCAKSLWAQGFTPIVYDNLSTGHREFVKWGPAVWAELTDVDSLVSVCRRYAPVAVIHLAALAVVSESVTHPVEYWRTNVTGTLCLLEAMRAAKINNLIFSSTCAVYGEPNVELIRETDSLNPVNPYGTTKLAAERMMDDFRRAYGIKSIRLRYFNAAGADPDGELGEDRVAETHLIPIALDAAMGRRPHMNIHGTDYPTNDGTAIRDYTHVTDLAGAHVESIKYLTTGGETTAVNLGTGQGSSVLDVIRIVEEIVGNPIVKNYTARRPGDPTRLVADPGKASAVLGWRPTLSSLSRIIGDAHKWHRARFRR